MDIPKAYSTKTPLISSSPTSSVQGVCEQAAIGFEDAYTTNEPERMPWFWADLDPDFVTSLSSYGLPVGSVIDLGGGSGTQAIALAKRGFQTTSTDFSLGAIEGGKRLAKEQSVNVDFIVDDVTNSRLKSQYDLVLDRGCFHIIAPARRENYLRTVLSCLAPDGWFFFKCFSAKEVPRPGPFRFTEDQIREFFAPHLEILELRETEFQGARSIFPKALFAVMRRHTTA